MVQGTGSNVGKSLIVAGLCRAFRRRGLRVRPFKPQNMSNNAAATAEGGEIGRAQALQALAAGVPPSVHMNPVLLKPEAGGGSQIIVQGQRFGTMAAREFGRRKAELLPRVLESFGILAGEAELIVIEGAGSPAEVNLRAGDIANMGFAEAADVPVMLVGDIDRGGVIASLVGTHALLADAERRRDQGVPDQQVSRRCGAVCRGRKADRGAHRLGQSGRAALFRGRQRGCLPRIPLDIRGQSGTARAARRASRSSCRSSPALPISTISTR